MRIAAIPRALTRRTEGFRDVFSGPQFRHFQEYLLGLVVGREGRNVQDIAGLFVHGCDQATLNHFLTDAPWSLAALWERLREVARRRLAARQPRRVFLSLDDTVAGKRYGPKMEAAGYHYSSVAQGLLWGHDAVAAVVSAGREAFAWGVELYRPKRTCAAGAFRSKVEIATGYVESFAAPGEAAVTLLGDAWYFCHRLVRAAQARGFDWIFACKRNRVVRVAGRKVTVGRLIRRLPLDELERVTIAGRHYVVASRLADFPEIGPGQLVVGAEVPKARRRIRRRDLRAIATNRRDWTGRTVLAQYVQRQRIETFVKDTKLHLGLGEYQLRKARGVQRHWALVACAHTVLRLLSPHRAAPAAARSGPWTIGRAAQRIEDLTQEAAMQWAHRQGRRHVKWRALFRRAA
jgi:hypothetical protein